ncbi:endonuclease/exonuclease/phosphatase family protein [Nonlabens ponticola]|uniref:Endonuclease/exonuclease/phosphatase n=1 Tax=Nonlabens ponticola TaxID=2496866 RepID=A0A3S9MV31_9FLAO|nr:endonuclease/exonuclease/phosphatase family protein [Nonlabens ponticola]AZQ43035.1 endonuclease/exonuclease/phosphatase [Nonlabens ponticola]
MSIPSQAFEQYTVAFYNLENLFDYTNDKHILDDDFTELGRKEWNQNRYEKKLKNLSDAISKIATDLTGKPPAIIGVAEVENKKVLNDLISQPKLAAFNYNFVHYNSPDERGIDVALLYRKDLFTVEESQPIHIHLQDDRGGTDTTRDILYVKGILAGMPLQLYVNHWPSRRDGAADTEHKRISVAQQLMEHVNRLDPEGGRTTIDSGTNILIMGDFNDDPNNNSIAQHLVPHGFTNITASLKKGHRGSLNHKFQWNLFDQILMSENLDNDVPGSLYVHQADIFDDIMLRQWKGKYRGQPARTFVGRRYTGGYSDHFPVYVILRRN